MTAHLTLIIKFSVCADKLKVYKDMNNNPNPQIILNIKGVNYRISTVCIEEFIENLSPITDIEDIQLQIEIIESMVIDGADENLSVAILKTPLKILREIKYLMSAFVTKV